MYNYKKQKSLFMCNYDNGILGTENQDSINLLYIVSSKKMEKRV